MFIILISAFIFNPSAQRVDAASSGVVYATVTVVPPENGSVGEVVLATIKAYMLSFLAFNFKKSYT